MYNPESVHTVLLGVISILLTLSLPWFVTIERRLSRIEQKILSDLGTVSKHVESMAVRLRNLELEHAQNHPHCPFTGGTDATPDI